jgi:hypothetical protein
MRKCTIRYVPVICGSSTLWVISMSKPRTVACEMPKEQPCISILEVD